MLIKSEAPGRGAASVALLKKRQDKRINVCPAFLHLMIKSRFIF